MKDSLTSLTPAEILTSIPAGVAEMNKLPHAPFASPGGFCWEKDQTHPEKLCTSFFDSGLGG